MTFLANQGLIASDASQIPLTTGSAYRCTKPGGLQ
jgi:hypothetical protein